MKEIKEVKKHEKITDQKVTILGYTQIKPEGTLSHEQALEFIESLFR